MKIRSITCFIDPKYPIDKERLKLGGDFLRIARPAFEAAGYEVQSARLATVPFPHLLPQLGQNQLTQLARELEAASNRLGYAYISIGPALPEFSASYGLIPEAMAATENVFFSGLMTTHDGKISLPAIQQCAHVIHRVSSISPDGFANLRFAALANVPAGSPFFPAAYHHDGEPSFALATEAADLAVQALNDAPSLQTACNNLVKAIEENARKITAIAREVERHSLVKFGGIDFSLAPFPSAEHSLGTALERIGVPAVGMHGSLAAAAILADAIDRARFMRAGFCGLMLPVLEDATLAMRVAAGTLGVTQLLLYSAVCGTGLDTIPLPGDMSADSLAAILLDLTSLAHRLDKPLTARLMPIPGKSAGDTTEFDFAFFANSRIMPVDAKPLKGLLDGNESFAIRRRGKH